MYKENDFKTILGEHDPELTNSIQKIADHLDITFQEMVGLMMEFKLHKLTEKTLATINSE